MGTLLSAFINNATPSLDFAFLCLLLGILGVVVGRVVVLAAYHSRGSHPERSAPTSPRDTSPAARAHNEARITAEHDAAWSSVFEALTVLAVGGFLLVVGITALLGLSEILLKIID